jgi:hypothetical protein
MSEVNDVESTEAPLPPPATAPLYDAYGMPLRPGDIVRTPLGVGKRRRRLYLYRVAVPSPSDAKTLLLVEFLDVLNGIRAAHTVVSQHGLDAEQAEIVAGDGLDKRKKVRR